jgi:hypothetical protein
MNTPQPGLPPRTGAVIDPLGGAPPQKRATVGKKSNGTSRQQAVIGGRHPGAEGPSSQIVIGTGRRLPEGSDCERMFRILDQDTIVGGCLISCRHRTAYAASAHLPVGIRFGARECVVRLVRPVFRRPGLA